MTRHIPPAKLKLDLKGAPAQTDQIVMVPVDAIHVLKNFNLRVEGDEFDAGIAELAASIEANGFYRDKPLTGYMTEGGVVVIDGHRRLAAVNQINGLDAPAITELPVVLKSEDASLADLHIAMIQSSTGKELSMFEKGLGVRRLIADGMDKGEVARRLGVSEKSIDNWIIVASAPTKARDMLLDGKITSTQILRATGKGKDAVAKLTGMVEKAKAEGREKAKPRDAKPTVAPIPNSVEVSHVETRIEDDKTFTVEIVKNGEMGAMLRSIATQLREVIPHDDGDADTTFAAGTITIAVSLVSEAKPKKRAKTKPVAEPVEPDPLAHAIDPESVDL